MNLEEVIIYILKEHPYKFDNATPLSQLNKVNNELCEVEASIMISTDDFNKELVDVIIASIGLMRFEEYKLVARCIINDSIRKYTGENLIEDILNKWTIVKKEYTQMECNIFNLKKMKKFKILFLCGILAITGCQMQTMPEKVGFGISNKERLVNKIR